MEIDKDSEIFNKRNTFIIAVEVNLKNLKVNR